MEHNAPRSRDEMEYELLDTGVFAENRYFDVEVEYAKAGPDDLVGRITVHNRGPEAAPIHLLPTLWFRNTWSWPPHDPEPGCRRSMVTTRRSSRSTTRSVGGSSTPSRDAVLLFCENETNAARVLGTDNATPYVKDGIGDARRRRPAGHGQPGARGHQGGRPRPVRGSRPEAP